MKHLPEENQKFISEFILEYRNKFGNLPSKDFSEVLISTGAAIIAIGSALRNNMERS